MPDAIAGRRIGARWRLARRARGRCATAAGPGSRARRSAVFRLLSALLAPADAPPPSTQRYRVDVAAFRTNVEAMIDVAERAGARVVLLDLVFVGPIYREVLQELATRRHVPLVDGRAILDAAYEQIERGTAYREEVEAWRAFYVANVVGVRPAYFDQAFYERHYGGDRAGQHFITMMADPIHPSAIGHHAIADALVPFVCPEAAADAD